MAKVVISQKFVFVDDSIGLARRAAASVFASLIKLEPIL